jgi:hypothetical protein
LISTPNAAVTSPDGVVTNRWHVREYLLPELLDLVAKAGFADTAVFCQRVPPKEAAGRLVLRVVARFPVLCTPGRWWDRLAHGSGEVGPWDGASVPSFWLLSCR